jgi:hypothetical protein
MEFKPRSIPLWAIAISRAMNVTGGSVEGFWVPPGVVIRVKGVSAHGIVVEYAMFRAGIERVGNKIM